MNPIAFILQVLAGQNMMIIDLLKMIVVLLGTITCIQVYNQFDLSTKLQKIKWGVCVVITRIDKVIMRLVDNRK